MAPKSRDRGLSTHTHTRSNSSSKMGTNNHQLTQKDLMIQAVKHNNDKKKAAHVYEPHPKIARVNSSQRISSKEQPPAPQAQKHKHPNPSHQHHHLHPQRSSGKGHHHTNNTNKSGFDIEASEGGGGDDNDDDWDTESGAVTPNHHDSEDDSTASDEEADGPAKPQQPTTHQQQMSSRQQQQQQLLKQSEPKNRQPNGQHTISESPTSLTELDKETGTLARVDTVRALDVQRLQKGAASAPQPELIQNSNPPEFRKTYRQEQQQQWEEPQERALQNGFAATGITASVNNTKTDVRRKAGTNGITPSPRSKVTSRPPSTYTSTTTTTSKSDLLRPHPLIRGPSFGHLSLNSSLGLPKPSPLAPLTVVPHATALSTSPPSMMNGSGGTTPYAPSSPTSLRTSSGGSPGSGSEEHGGMDYVNDRRMSLSSQLSMPIYSSVIRESSGSASIAGFRHNRVRTLSTLSSSSSSSAALSSLAHLPTGVSASTSNFPFTSNTFAGTRPPSPQAAHPISFFPPVNPHANVESIHPLLPHPYLGNHLAVLAKMTPIRESLKRVLSARNTAASVSPIHVVVDPPRR